MKKLIKDPWYLLFKGWSADDRGQPEYFGRTEDEAAARKFYLEDKYSNSHVIVATHFDDRIIYEHCNSPV